MRQATERFDTHSVLTVDHNDNHNDRNLSPNILPGAGALLGELPHDIIAGEERRDVDDSNRISGILGHVGQPNPAYPGRLPMCGRTFPQDRQTASFRQPDI